MCLPSAFLWFITVPSYLLSATILSHSIRPASLPNKVLPTSLLMNSSASLYWWLAWRVATLVSAISLIAPSISTIPAASLPPIATRESTCCCPAVRISLGFESGFEYVALKSSTPSSHVSLRLAMRPSAENETDESIALTNDGRKFPSIVAFHISSRLLSPVLE